MSLLRAFAQRILPMLLLVAGIFGFLSLKAAKQQPEPRDGQTPAPLVATVPVAVSDREVDVLSDGIAVPHRQIEIAAEVSGRVVEMSEDCRIGRTVKAGQALLKIDPRDYQNEIDRLTAERAQADAQLNELDVELQNSDASLELAREDVSLQKSERERIENLSRSGVSTQSALDAARRNELSTRDALVKQESQRRLLTAQRAQLEQAVKLVDVQLDQAQRNLSRCTIAAPADGVVVLTMVEEGGYLKSGDKVVTIDDTSVAEVRTNLEMRTLAWIRAQAEPVIGAGPFALPPVPVTVIFELAGNSYAWQGVLERYEGAGIDERTRTVPVMIRVPNPRAVSLRSGRSDLPFAAPSILMRGMFVKVALHSHPPEGWLSVPMKGVLPGSVVWAVRDGQLHKVELSGSRAVRGEVLVAPSKDGLTDGDRVVVSPLNDPREGMKVREVPGNALIAEQANTRATSLAPREARTAARENQPPTRPTGVPIPPESEFDDPTPVASPEPAVSSPIGFRQKMPNATEPVSADSEFDSNGGRREDRR